MKVDELRGKLFELEKHEIIRLAVEFYKLVPKAKKEDYDLDTLINTPEIKTAKPAEKVAASSLDDIELEVNTFIVNAKAQYYLYNNKVVSKKERLTWRFKVKAWYKELTNPKNTGFDKVKKTKIITDLYNLLCESCRYQYFTGEDTFNSVGIPQTDFFQTVLQMIDRVEGASSLLNRGLDMAINNGTGPNTLESYTMQEYVKALGTPQSKYHAIEKAEIMLLNNKPPVTAPQKRGSYPDSSMDSYYRKRKTNNLAEMGFRLYAGLLEYDEAIAFFNKYAIEHDDEIKLYALVRLLFEDKQQEAIQSVLKDAIKAGIKPRSSLNKLLATIQKTGELPQYIG